jgi:hypothetical protein
MPNIGMVSMLDAETGETVDWYQFQKVRLNYENIIGKVNYFKETFSKSGSGL